MFAHLFFDCETAETALLLDLFPHIWDGFEAGQVKSFEVRSFQLNQRISESLSLDIRYWHAFDTLDIVGCFVVCHATVIGASRKTHLGTTVICRRQQLRQNRETDSSHTCVQRMPKAKIRLMLKTFNVVIRYAVGYCVLNRRTSFLQLQLKKLGKTREVSRNQPRCVFPLTLAERILGASNNASLNFEPPRKFASRVIPKQYIES